jgi:hypothetical protein
MVIEFLCKLLLLPFRFVGEFVSAFIYSHKPKEVEPPEVRELKRRIVKLCALNSQKEDLILLLQGTIEEMEYRHKLEKKEIEDHWCKIVRDLERQLSQTRMQLKDQH